MLTFVYWNMDGDFGAQKKTSQSKKINLLRSLKNLADLYEVDLFVLAECPLSIQDMLNFLNVKNPIKFRKPTTTLCERVILLPRFPNKFVKAKLESKYYTCRHISLPARKDFLLVAVHLGSKLWKDEDDQTLSVTGFSREIRELELKKTKCDRTIVMGDLNLHPFDTAMVGAEGMNAVMTRAIAVKGQRTMDAKPYPFFYNPMWGHFGDLTHEEFPVGHDKHQPAGTCYYWAKKSKWYFWNMFDQVLIRPALLPHFKSENLKILHHDGVSTFLNDNGEPNRSYYSDHLPILLRLSI